MRAVLDTNVIVSGVISEHGAPRRIIQARQRQEFTLSARSLSPTGSEIAIVERENP